MSALIKCNTGKISFHIRGHVSSVKQSPIYHQLNSVGIDLMPSETVYFGFLVTQGSAVAGSRHTVDIVGCRSWRLDAHLLTKPVINDEVVADLIVAVTLWQT